MLETTGVAQTSQGNGATAAFSFDFQLPDAPSNTALKGYLVITITDTTVSPTVVTVLDDANYTLFMNPGNVGGTVLYPTDGSFLPAGVYITRERVMPLTQEIELQNQSGLFLAQIEEALDNQMMAIQQLQAQINLALRLQITDPDGPWAEAPLKASLANMFWAGNSNGDLVGVSGGIPELPVSAFMQAVLTSTDSAAAATLLGFVRSNLATQAGQIFASFGNNVPTTIGSASADGQILQARAASVGGMWWTDSASIGIAPLRGWKNLAGANNTSTPSSRFDLSFQQAVFGANSLGPAQKAFSGISGSIDILTQGAGGRDQVATFSASSWIYIYGIGQYTSSVTNFIASANSTSPTLPTGYGYFQLAGAIYVSASGTLSSTYLRGNKGYWGSPPAIFSTATVSTSEFTASLAAYVPPIATSHSLRFSMTGTSTTAGAYNSSANLRLVTGVNYFTMPVVIVTNGNAGAETATVELPYVSSSLMYALTSTTNLASLGLSATPIWFGLPNGAN